MPDIIYSDSSIAVINKPAGMLSVPGKGAGKQNSAAARIRSLFPGCIMQPSVHRLDMDTSGLLVFALTAEAHRDLSIQFQNSAVNKKYIAVLEGKLDKRLGRSGRIELKFRLDPDNRPYQVFDPVQGKPGVSLWKIIDNVRSTERVNSPEQTRIEFTPLTGRTHQLRLHAAHPVNFISGMNTGGLGCPISGDRLYGSSSDSEHEAGTRMLLHASELEFRHPLSGRKISFSSQPAF